MLVVNLRSCTHFSLSWGSSTWNSRVMLLSVSVTRNPNKFSSRDSSTWRDRDQLLNRGRQCSVTEQGGIANFRSHYYLQSSANTVLWYHVFQHDERQERLRWSTQLIFWSDKAKVLFRFIWTQSSFFLKAFFCSGTTRYLISWYGIISIFLFNIGLSFNAHYFE